MRYIIAIFVTIILGLPYALDAFAGKIVEFQGSKYEVVEDENGEMLFKPVGVKPLEGPRVTELPFVIHGSEPTKAEPIIEEPVEFKKKTVVETKVLQTCNDSLDGCVMTDTGDCPGCKTEVVREETTEIIETDFMKFKKSVSDRIAFEKMKSEEEVPYYLQPIEYLRTAGHPAYPCYKVQRTCREGAPIDIKDLYASYKVASMCNAMGFSIDFTDPIKSCSRSTIVNL